MCQKAIVSSVYDICRLQTADYDCFLAIVGQNSDAPNSQRTANRKQTAVKANCKQTAVKTNRKQSAVYKCHTPLFHAVQGPRWYSSWDY